MFVIARFDRAKHVDCRDIGAGKGAIVHHLLDARAAGGDLARQIGETTGPVADHGGEARQAPIGNETSLHDAAEHVWIDVAAAQEEHNLLAR